MPIINGVINKVSQNSPLVINGGKTAIINGNRPYGYDKWRMVWNGNHFAPPESGSVLYLPGYPGFGSVIHDFSTNYSDSGIDTNEELTAVETGIDCDADATTAIPVGTVIQIESEKCMVTATGTTLTVNRGYGGTVATTHNTNIDILGWLPNNGTITGATWVRLPSGLSILNYDGSDDIVTVPDAASIQNIFDGAGGEALAWIYPLSDGENDNGIIFDKGNTDTTFGWSFRVTGEAAGKLKLKFVHRFSTTVGEWITTATEVFLNRWSLVSVNYNSSNVANNPTIKVNGVTVALTTTSPVGTRKTDVGQPLILANNPLTTRTFSGYQALWRLVIGSSDDASIFSRERSLFGVA